MPVFNTYMKIVKKNLFMAILYTAIFIFLTFAFSGSIQQNSSGGAGEENGVLFEDAKLTISIIDKDKTVASAAFTDFISTRHKIVDIGEDKDDILDALYYTRVDYVLTIEEGYEEKLSAGGTSGLFTNYQVPGSFDGVFLDNTLNQYVSILSAYMAGGHDMPSALDKTAATMSKETEVKVELFTDGNEGDSEYPERTKFFFNFLPYGLIASLISILSTVLIKINGREVSFRANCSSTTAMSQTMQILLGSIVLVLITWIVFMIAGVLINGGMFTGKCWLAVLNSFAFILVAAGIAILISILKSDSRSVAMIANIVSLGMSFLCGVFVDQTLLDEKVLAVSRFLPAYWYIKANDMLISTTSETFSNSEFMTCIGIEALFAAALFAVIMLVSKAKHGAK